MVLSNKRLKDGVSLFAFISFLYYKQITNLKPKIFQFFYFKKRKGTSERKREERKKKYRRICKRLLLLLKPRKKEVEGVLFLIYIRMLKENLENLAIANT